MKLQLSRSGNRPIYMRCRGLKVAKCFDGAFLASYGHRNDDINVMKNAGKKLYLQPLEPKEWND